MGGELRSRLMGLRLSSLGAAGGADQLPVAFQVTVAGSDL